MHNNLSVCLPDLIIDGYEPQCCYRELSSEPLKEQAVL